MKTLLAFRGFAILILATQWANAVAAQSPPDSRRAGNADSDVDSADGWLSAWRYGGSAGIGFDSNPGNAEVGKMVPATGYGNAGLNAGWMRHTTDDSALQLRASVDAQQYFRYAGLSNLRAALQVRELYRPGGGFFIPTFAVWGSAAGIGSRSSLRSGGEYRGGASVAEQINTAIGLRLGGYASERDAGSDTLTLRHRSATLDADWRLDERLSSHFGYEYRSGSFAISSPADPGALALASARQPDDTLAVDGVANIIYRLTGYAHIATFGLNYALSPALALDAQMQKIHTQADSGDHYDRWLVEVSVLRRF